MKNRLALIAVVAAVAACGGGTNAAGSEMAAATFLVEFVADDLVLAGRDRLAGTGEENRLDVLRPAGEIEIVPIHAGTPVPDPFEFVRDPLAPGGIDSVLDSSERIVAVVYPLIDRTPGGRVLAASLIGIGAGGNLAHTDWDEESTQRVADLLAWGADRGLDPLPTLELAVRGLSGGDDAPEGADEAAGFLR
jgi:hypothetical protein